MATVRDLVTASLREIGVLAAGETASSDDTSLALDTLARWMDSEGLDPLTIPTITRTVFDIIENVGVYNTSGGIDAYELSVSDGFDTSWTSAPPGWTMSGNPILINDDSDFQSGGHSVHLFGDSGSTVPAIYQDYVFPCGAEVTLTIWGHSDSLNTTHVQFLTMDTSHYLNSSGDWVGVAADVFDIADGLVWTEETLTFDLESAEVVGANTCTVRVILYNETSSGDGFFDTFSLVAAGLGAIAIDRPDDIDRINLITATSTPTSETPLTKLTEDGWASVGQKDLTSTQPSHWYYSPTYPYGTLQLWPVPTGSDLQCALYTKLPLVALETLDQLVILPPGYQRFIVKNLAVELCPSFEKQPSALLVQQAGEARGRVKRRNRRVADLSFEGAALIGQPGRYNIRTDQ